MFKVDLHGFVAFFVAAGVFAHDFDGVFELFSGFDGDDFFDDAESSDAELPADDVRADFLAFIVRIRRWNGLCGKVLQPLLLADDLYGVYEFGGTVGDVLVG
jgi:hypothetical protein